jgi:hypothetical protein
MARATQRVSGSIGMLFIRWRRRVEREKKKIGHRDAEALRYGGSVEVTAKWHVQRSAFQDRLECYSLGGWKMPC